MITTARISTTRPTKFSSAACCSCYAGRPAPSYASGSAISHVSFFTVVGRFPPVLSITMQPPSDGDAQGTFVNIREQKENSSDIASIGAGGRPLQSSAYAFDTDVDESRRFGTGKRLHPRSFRLRALPTPPISSSASSPHHPDAALPGQDGVGTGEAASTWRGPTVLSRGRHRRRTRSVVRRSPPRTPWSTDLNHITAP